MPEAPRTRRRGAELDRVLLEAAWEELYEGGYDSLSFEAIARRAHTSKPVVYRRWPGKPELVRALVDSIGERFPMEDVDTGSVRTDLIEFLAEANDRRAALIVAMMPQIAGLYRASGTTFQDIDKAAAPLDEILLDRILERGVARGEIDAGKLIGPVRRLAPDLYLYRLLVTMSPLTRDQIEEIVDLVFLPLVRP